ncbi:alanine racemase, partial [Dermatophilus congolensis]
MNTPPAITRLARNLHHTQLPAYIYDLPSLHHHITTIRAALPPNLELYYATKANPDPHILTTLEPHIDGFEVSSSGELTHVTQHTTQRPIAFSGPAKTETELTTAINHNTHRIHIESINELHQLAHHTNPNHPTNILLRLNLPNPPTQTHHALTMAGTPTPFGLDPEQTHHALTLLTNGTYPHLHLKGIHTHLASGLNATEALTNAGHIINHTATLSHRHNIPLNEIVLGGGMNVDYTNPHQRFDWNTYGTGIHTILTNNPHLTLRIEPGRSLTAYCGWYITEILDVKTSHGSTVAVVRGGTHHIRTPATKNHNQPATVIPINHWPHPWPRPTSPTTPHHAIVSGQLCTPKDVLSRAIPTPLRAGDRIAFSLAGAYAWNISHHEFLMHPHPTT